VEGKKEGRPRRVFIYNVCDHAECYREVRAQAISYTTGVPAMVGGLMMLSGEWRGAGVFNMERSIPNPSSAPSPAMVCPGTSGSYDRRLDLGRVATPCWVLDLAKLSANVELLGSVRARAGCKILLALKGTRPGPPSRYYVSV